ncbi:TetR/AcrR family transcriptional regulator [Pseudoruegeria sp. SK021]|uniref:TetR/AcrR family transcriptional regulator n=1 Tax=Pseudoruegeria sp. SK021 TaxID=1933035 RepID=UPI000A24A34E|nr:TetR/AcrR family transcriptional regulator [Pseudoruegeria sp. SK021]OSP54981.1 hypothetical protein BV911_10045 [Pseudoruegeria sp. SK021]
MNKLDCTGPDHIPQKRRHAAGADPAKRDQILDGAVTAFFSRGFDGTSMNDVCRASNVSKGTLYVYFADKVALFEAMVSRERDRLFLGLEATLTSDRPLAEKLTIFGRQVAESLGSDRVIRTHRMVIGAVETLPELGVRFYDSGARRGQAGLLKLLEREITLGHLRIPDPALGASQFLELCLAGTFRQRLLGKAPLPPAPDRIAATVDSAVTMFLTAYAVGDRQGGTGAV